MRTHSRIIFLAGILSLTALSAFGSTLDVVFYSNQFGTVNDATGAYTQIGTLPLSQSAGIATLDGLIYLENMGSDLYTVDPVTGVSSLVGATGLTTVSGAFAGDANGLFEVDYLSNLYSIDPLTGQAQLVGATGLIANGGSYDTSLSGNGASLYYTVGAPGVADELYEINTTTGVATDLGSTGVTGIAGSAIVGSELELFQYGKATNYIYSAPVGLTDFVADTKLGAQIVDGGVPAPTITSSDGPFVAVAEPPSGLLWIAGILSLALMAAARRHFNGAV